MARPEGPKRTGRSPAGRQKSTSNAAGAAGGRRPGRPKRSGSGRAAEGAGPARRGEGASRYAEGPGRNRRPEGAASARHAPGADRGRRGEPAAAGRRAAGPSFGRYAESAAPGRRADGAPPVRRGGAAGAGPGRRADAAGPGRRAPGTGPGRRSDAADAAARRAPGPGRRAEGAAAVRRAKGAAAAQRAGAPAPRGRYGAAPAAFARDTRGPAAPQREAAAGPRARPRPAAGPRAARPTRAPARQSAPLAAKGARQAAPGGDAADHRAQKAFDRRRASARREAAQEADGLLYGRHPIAELLRSGGAPHKLWLLAQHLRPDASWAGLVAQAQARGAQIEEADAEQLQAMVGDAVHQGAVALVPPFAYAALETLLPAKGGGEAPGGVRPLLLVLDQVQDPHNLGALTRSAAAFGATGVVIAKDRGARMTPTAIKASAGAAYHVPVAQVVNLARALETMRARGVWTVGLDVGGEQTLQNADLCGAVALVVGAEGEGLRPLVARGCDFRVKLPLARIGSLNASVAGAIALYEVARARTGQDAKAQTSA